MGDRTTNDDAAAGFIARRQGRTRQDLGPASRGRGIRRGPVSGVLVGVAALALVAALTGCSTADSAPASTFGGMPSYLPKSSLKMDRTLTGTAARPALTTEGDAVRVKLSDGTTVLGNLIGPVVPGEGLPYQPDATTATFTMTLSNASSAIPIDLAQFNLVDHLGKVYHPALVPGETAPPAALEPGQKVSFQLRVVMVTGEGIMQWAPDGKTPLAEWDFVLEDD